AVAAWSNRVDRLNWRIATRDEYQIVRDKRRRRCNFRHWTERPQLFSRRRIVTANFLRADGDQFSARLAFVNGWGSPRRKLLARSLPEFFTCFDVVSSDERVLLNVGLHDHHVLIDDG